MSPAQERLIATIRSYGDNAEFWPVVNDWVRDSGRAKALALRNINRSVDALLKANLITIEDGLFKLTERAK